MSVGNEHAMVGPAFGVLLRRHRLAAGFSQEVLAERSGLSTNGISALERGERRYPYRETVKVLAKTLNLTADAEAVLVAAAERPRQRRERSVRGTLFTDRRGSTTNLPSARTTIFGRSAEIEDLVRILGVTRVLTVTGAGGIGKTCAALAVGERLVRKTEDGVWLVELAPVVEAPFVGAAIARALSVQESPNRPLLETLLAYLRNKALVLILDNCEHVIAEVAALADALLRSCPKVRILATSREPLRISGERTYRLPSLEIPTAAEIWELSAARAARYPAVSLFVQRAQAIDHQFALNDEEAPAIGDICRRLDGIPLAIELAAARVSILPPRALCEQIDQRFRLLTNGDRTGLPRHQTMRATLDWSYGLLEQRDRTLFRRLGVFVDGFSIKGAFAVGTDADLNENDIFDALASLVEKSLVMADPHGDFVRYHLLQSTRVYAAERLVEAGERDALASRHLRYFHDWFIELRREHEQLRPALSATFRTELDNLRVALDGSLIRRELHLGAELLAAIGSVWISGGGVSREGIARYETFLAELNTGDSLLLTRLAAGLSNLFSMTGRLTRARETAITAISYARDCGDDSALAWALRAYANALLSSGDVLGVEAALTEAQSIQEVSPLLRLHLLEIQSRLSLDSGDLDSAARIFALLRAEWRSAGFRLNEAISMADLGAVEFRRGQYERAAELLGKAALLARNANASTHLPSILVALGQVLAVSGAIDAAVAPANEAIMLCSRREPGHLDVMLAIELLAYIAAARGDVDRFACLAAYADANIARIGYIRDYEALAVHDRLKRIVHELLTVDELARITAEGAALNHEAAIVLARTSSQDPQSGDGASRLSRRPE